MQAVGRGSWDGRGQVGDGELESEIWAEMGLGCDRHASVCGFRHVGRGWGGRRQGQGHGVREARRQGTGRWI